MSMFKIYCDEAGNTGGNLGDADQPVFALCTVIIADGQEAQLVCDLCAYVLSKQAANTKHGTTLKPGIQ